MSGAEANFSGRNFEDRVGEWLASQLGYEIIEYKDLNIKDVDVAKQRIRGQKLLIRNMKRDRSNQQRQVATIEWYIAETDTYVECKYQTVTGTASQKIPYAMIDALFNSCDGSNTLFVLGGEKLVSKTDEEYYAFVCGQSDKLSYVYATGEHFA